MQSYRFSPIEDKAKLLEAITYIHVACHKLSLNSFGVYLPIVGNVGIFCHYDDEYQRLRKIQQEMVDLKDDYNGKYFRLHEPIIITKTTEAPAAVYTHLYIRRPDPYRSRVGDLDFYMPPTEYQKLKQSLLEGMKLTGLRALDRTDIDLIELHAPDNDTLAYINPTTL
jgi:hypothetical protein